MTTLKERINDYFKDLGGRFRNPVILSFIFVWLYQNWSLIFIYYNLDPRFSFGEKLFILRIYLNGIGINGVFWNPLLFAFISLVSYYLIGIIAQIAKHLFAERLNTAAIRPFDKGKYVKRSEHQKIKDENKALKTKEETLDAEIFANKSKIKQREIELEQLINTHATRIEEKDTEIGSLKASASTALDDNKKLKKDIAGLSIVNQQITTELEEAKEGLKNAGDVIKQHEKNLKNNPKIKTYPEEIFGDYTWQFTFFKDDKAYNETFTLAHEDGKYYFKTNKGKITITQFVFDSERNMVGFQKTNLQRNYANVQTMLIRDSIGGMSGLEGDLIVQYKRLGEISKGKA